MSVSSQQAALMKFISMLMSPDFAEMTGTYDPMVFAQQQMGQQQLTPISDQYTNSSNEDIALVFNDLVAGNIDPITAKNQLTQVFGAGADTKPLYSAVDSVVKEQAAALTGGSGGSKKKGSPYEEAYLPSPMEQYTDNPALAPLLPKAAQKVEQYGKRSTLLKKAAKGRGTLSGSARREFNIPPELQGRFNQLTDSDKRLLFDTLQKSAKGASDLQNAYIQGNAALLSSAGRTPYSDALAKRAMAAAQFLSK